MRTTFLDESLPAGILSGSNILYGRRNAVFLAASHRALPVFRGYAGRSEPWRDLSSVDGKNAVQSIYVELIDKVARSLRAIIWRPPFCCWQPLAPPDALEVATVEVRHG
ncbi:hypothetical protein [Methylobacterium sp. NEAU K]|uniref:hypothetical protein n=1 Tax=Methylobacterium sp. NEAU K TaxID=3064946 RepID=UPI002735282A|nr:hypothetical protein [Methylobacterium sp. NEAU K]MDP4005123.1 hypothetical protein [Methylobacterium sp. NEAU K]